MRLEEDFFKHTRVDISRLQPFGFILQDGRWQYSEMFLNGDFKAVITVDAQANITGEVYETDSDDVYFPLRIESMAAGGYVGKVRNEYEKILQRIKEQCCNVCRFMTPQAERLVQVIDAEYGEKPEFPWQKFPDYGTFKNLKNHKWYALIGHIDRAKLDASLSGETEFINLKSDPDKIQGLLQCQGFYPAYHMNKKNWVTVILDDTVSDLLLKELIHESRMLSMISH